MFIIAIASRLWIYLSCNGHSYILFRGEAGLIFGGEGVSYDGWAHTLGDLIGGGRGLKEALSAFSIPCY